MASVYVRDVSDDALAVLKVRAAQARQSLQAYLRDLVEREAGRPTLDEAMVRAQLVAAMNTPSSPVENSEVLAAVDAGRAGR